MNTWQGELFCGLCSEQARPTYPVINGQAIVVCARCDFPMMANTEVWRQVNGAQARMVEKLAAEVAHG